MNKTQSNQPNSNITSVIKEIIDILKIHYNNDHPDKDFKKEIQDKPPQYIDSKHNYFTDLTHRMYDKKYEHSDYPYKQSFALCHRALEANRDNNDAAAWLYLSKASLLTGFVIGVQFGNEDLLTRNAAKGNKVRSEKFLKAKHRAAELIYSAATSRNTKTPNTSTRWDGWISPTDAAEAIKNDLAKFNRDNGIPLKEYCLLTRIVTWIRDGGSVTQAFNKTCKSDAVYNKRTRSRTTFGDDFERRLMAASFKSMEIPSSFPDLPPFDSDTPPTEG